MPIVKNLSKSNIVIFNKVLEPGKKVSLNQDQIDEIQHLFDSNQLKVETQQTTQIDLNENQNKDFLEIKERLLPAFFALYLDRNLDKEQLNDLIWFYKNIGPTSQLNHSIKSLLDDVNSGEELIEILLNHIYPELIKNHLKN